MENKKECLKSKICRICGIEKELRSFNRHISFKDGYQSRCKLCIKKGFYIYKDNDTLKEYGFSELLRLRKPSKSDYREMWKLMKSLGYDIHSPISTQFENRYGFEKTNFNINKDNITYFSAKECGLT